MEVKKLEEGEISHPLNEALLKEAEEIQSERRLLKERLEKLEGSRQGVSNSVYQRVRADYLSRLNQTMEKLKTLRRELEQEQKILLDKKTLVEAQITSRRQTIEEAELRYTLGEFSADQHQEVVRNQQGEIQRLETALQPLNDGLERHKRIFEGEEWVEVTAPPAPPVKPSRPATPVPPERGEPSYPQDTAKIRIQEAATDRVGRPPEGAVKKAAELLVLENGKVGQVVPLDKTVQIGRSPSNDVVLKEAKVSRKHAEIHFAGGKYILLDLESSNGTFVGGKRVTEQVLQPNDEITIGNTKMVFKA